MSKKAETEIYHIAIDGPCASGKGTVAKELATRLGACALDTGAMYRAVGLHVFGEKALQVGEDALINMAINHLELSAKIKNGVTHVSINGVDVTDKIRTPEVGQFASKVYPFAQAKVTELIREIAKGQSLILEGREIASHVLPDARFKFYLTAKCKIRALRRLADTKCEDMTLKQMTREVKTRDRRDKKRKAAPLRRVRGAVVIDNTKMDVEQTIDAFLRVIK